MFYYGRMRLSCRDVSVSLTLQVWFGCVFDMRDQKMCSALWFLLSWISSVSRDQFKEKENTNELLCFFSLINCENGSSPPDKPTRLKRRWVITLNSAVQLTHKITALLQSVVLLLKLKWREKRIWCLESIFTVEHVDSPKRSGEVSFTFTAVVASHQKRWALTRTKMTKCEIQPFYIQKH